MTHWFIALIYLTFIILILIVFEPLITFWRKGRDPRGRGTIIPQYEPPDHLPPVEMGSLVDERVHLRDISATIIDLAVRGYLKIKKIPDTKSWIFKKDDYEFIQTTPKRKSDTLNLFEKKILKHIFGNTKKKKLSKLENKFYKHLTDLKEKVYTNLVDKGYFLKPPDKTRGRYAIKGIVIFVIGFFLITTEAIILGTAFSLVFLINGILTLILAYFMPRKTKKGKRAFEHILGFKQYLKTAECDRLRFQEKEHLFYQFLPYAMTLGVASKWSKAFQDIFKNPPDWYEGFNGSFCANRLVNNLNNAFHQMETSFRSAPGSGGRYSSSSGFSGGFSGGGFGGGGGGSW